MYDLQNYSLLKNTTIVFNLFDFQHWAYVAACGGNNPARILSGFLHWGLFSSNYTLLHIIIDLLLVARWMVCSFKSIHNNGNGVLSPECSQLSCGFFVLKDDIMLNA